MRLLSFGLVSLCLSSSLLAQKAPAPPQLSPKSAYDEAMRPLDVTRHSIANWSDIEIDALKVTIARAADACKARDVKTFTDATLIDYARLCALGQAWPMVVEATGRYISAETPDKPLLNQAYAVRIDAELRLKDQTDAVKDSLAMLKAVPYDTLTAQTIDEAVDFLEVMYTQYALLLETTRQPFLLKKFAEAAVAIPKPDPVAPNALPPQTLHELYTEGILYASIQQFANKPASAAATVAEIDAALPTTLAPDDLIPIQFARKRYSFLGKPLPKIPMTASLSLPNVLPSLPAQHAITVLLLFPDWCSQCVRMGKDFPRTVFQVEGAEAYLYGLMAETLPPATKVAMAAGETPRPTAKELLAETPTVTVPPTVLTQFAAEDFPLLIMTDSHGIVRLLQSVGEDVLEPRGTMDTAVGRIATIWPLNPPKPAPATPEVAPQ